MTTIEMIPEQAIGYVITAMYELGYSKKEIQRVIETNKVEAYHGFSGWLCFGGDGIISDNDPEQQEKVIKYNELVTNALIFQNVVDITAILRELIREGYMIDSEDVRFMSPYLTSHIKRFGDYIIDLGQSPKPFEGALDFTG
jgi:hypothetical protein